MHVPQLTPNLKQEATRLGFNAVGICPAVTPAGIHRFRDWLAAGYAGQMHYLEDRAAAYEHPEHVLHGVRSLVMLRTDYWTGPAPASSPGTGRVSRYAGSGLDYHDVIHARLKQLAQFVRQEVPTALTRGVVDTAPLLEREFAQMAGLGWIGKNTLLLNRQSGSWFFLAALLTNLELDYDDAYETDHCGSCRACLDVCPTQAFPQPYLLDARRCLSYLTIELRDLPPTELRGAMGDWVFGCDLCQEVCPWSQRAPLSPDEAFRRREDLSPLALLPLFELDENAFRERFRRTPLWRAKRRGILRNAALALGNRPFPAAIPTLQRALQDAEPLVRGAAAWALGRFPQASARAAIEQHQAHETDEMVLSEMAAALAGSPS